MSAAAPKKLRVEIGVFAHNEEVAISTLVAELSRQSLFDADHICAAIHVLANGCSDETVQRSKEAISHLPWERRSIFQIQELAEPGKSRTWNRFVHDLSRPEADLLICMDADIILPNIDVLARLCAALENRPNLHVCTSRPVKDLELSDQRLSFIERLISMGSGSLSNWRNSICGQLYAIRSSSARCVWMPIGLPVEDGFLRAMVLTDLLTQPEQLHRIDGDDATWHVYASERTVGGLVRHQTRIVVGGAINAMLFGVMRRDAPKLDDARALLKLAAGDELWLERTERRELPHAPFGYVPPHFLIKRVTAASTGEWPPNPKRIMSLVIGFPMDVLVYLLATLRMARARGAGYW